MTKIKRLLSLLLTVLLLLPGAILPAAAEEMSVIADAISFMEITKDNASKFGNSTSYSAALVPEGRKEGSITGLNRPVPYWTPVTPVGDGVEVLETLGISWTPGKTSDLGVAFRLYIADEKSLGALLNSSFGLMVQFGTTDSQNGPCFNQQASGKALGSLSVGWNDVVVKHNAAWMAGGTPDLNDGVYWIKFRLESLGENGLSYAINDIRLVRTTQTDTFSLSIPKEGGSDVKPVDKVVKDVTDGTGVIEKQLSFIEITKENAGEFGSSSSASSDYLPEGAAGGCSLTGFSRTVEYWAPTTPTQKPVDVSVLDVTADEKNSDLGVAAWLWIGDREALDCLMNSDFGFAVEFGTDVSSSGDRWIQQVKMAALKDLSVGWNEIVMKHNPAWTSGKPVLDDGIRWIRFRLENLGATGLNFALYDIRLVRTSQTNAFAVNNALPKEEDEQEKIEVGVPFGITMQPGTNETELGFNWLVYGKPESPVLRLVRAADKGGEWLTLPAAAEKTSFASDGSDLYTVKVNVTGLLHLTEYVYTVGDAKETSPEYRFTTPASSDFKALVLSDIHIIEDMNWGRELSVSGDYWKKSLSHYAETRDFSLIVSLGDQMQNTTRAEYLKLFLAPDELRSRTLAVLNGNHDTSPQSENLLAFFNQGNQIPSTAECNMGDYFFRYGKALFVMLNISQNETWDKYDHSLVFKAAKEAFPDYKWLIVGAHYPIYGPSSDVSDRTMEGIYDACGQVCELLDTYHADLFIDGHTHVYARSHLISEGQIADGGDPALNTYTDANGTVFVTMGCATEMWELYVNEHSRGGEWIKTELENTPTYQILEAVGNKLILTVYGLKDDKPIDTLTLVKTSIPENDGAGETAESPADSSAPDTAPSDTPSSVSSPVGWIIGAAAVTAAGLVIALKKKK